MQHYAGSLFNVDEEVEEMSALLNIDDVPLKKGKTKSKTSKATSSKKKGGKSQGKEVTIG